MDAHENIRIKIYNPGVNLGKNLFAKLKKFTTDFRSANQRMHNKTFIVDGSAAITGGRNIANEYFDYDHEYNFRDRDVLLLGKTVNKMSDSFNDFWASDLSVDAGKLLDEKLPIDNDFETLHEYACNPENFSPHIRKRLENLPKAFHAIEENGDLAWVDNVTYVSDIPGKNDGKSGLGGSGATTQKLMRLIKNAKESIDIQTPYLITTELGQNLFRAAVDRGVKVRILTNSLASTDNLEAFSAYQGSRSALLDAGVRIFEFKPDAKIRSEIMTDDLHNTLEHQPTFGLHAKSMVVDNQLTVIGTFNLDPRSANLNTECITVIDSQKIAKKVLKGMEQEFQKENSWETTKEYNPDSEVGRYKRLKTWTRKVLPKSIL